MNSKKYFEMFQYTILGCVIISLLLIITSNNIDQLALFGYLLIMFLLMGFITMLIDKDIKNKFGDIK
jgi:hypothetical protein